MNFIPDWIEESKKFDLVADIYDLYRPSYPEEMITDLTELSKISTGSSILEIGAGSGKATDCFLGSDKAMDCSSSSDEATDFSLGSGEATDCSSGSGYKMTCIEQGEHLVAKARDKYKDFKNVTFVCSPFQDWEVSDNKFDLAFAAQSFHWIPKPLGYKKIAKSLKENGVMALFWNKYINQGDSVSNELAALLREYKVLSMIEEKGLQTFKHRTIDGIATTNLFEETDVYQYPWKSEYTFNEFMNFISTGNGYISLDAQDKQVLSIRLMEIFSKNDYKINMNLNCVLFVVRKKSQS